MHKKLWVLLESVRICLCVCVRCSSKSFGAIRRGGRETRLFVNVVAYVWEGGASSAVSQKCSHVLS